MKLGHMPPPETGDRIRSQESQGAQKADPTTTKGIGINAQEQENQMTHIPGHIEETMGRLLEEEEKTIRTRKDADG